jgi:hypothetical protein
MYTKLIRSVRYCLIGLHFFMLLSVVHAQNVVSIEIKSSKPDTAQLFYDIGQGLSEANSAKVKLKGNMDFERVEFAIPAGNLKALRLDPLQKPGFLEIRKASLKSADKAIPIPLEQFVPANHIVVNKIQDGVLYLETTPDATDPQVLLKVITPADQALVEQAQNTATWVPYGLVVLFCFIILYIQLFKKQYYFASLVKFTASNQMYFWVSLIIIFAFLFSYKFIRLANGNILNCYPLISPDGFDWYTEGAYLISRIRDVDLPSLNVLRPPGFVCITALDYLAGENGVVIGAFLFIVLIGNYLIIRSIISNINPASNGFSVNLILFVSFTFFPINYISPWLLADLYAMFFSLLSVLLLLEFLESDSLAKLCLSSGIALIGSLFQTWAFIPFLVVCFCLSSYHLLKRRKNSLKCLFAVFISGTIHVVLIGCWRSFMPHTTTPSNFELLKLDFAMLDFYINVWIFILGPFLAYIFYSAFTQGRNNKLCIKSFSILGITLAFILLCLMYQWRESRFTYYFFPWFVVLFFSCFKLTNIMEKTFLIGIVLLVCILVPANYWQPQISSAKISFNHAWFSDYFKAAPINRNILNQADNSFLEHSDNYVKSSISMYNVIKTKNVANRVP